MSDLKPYLIVPVIDVDGNISDKKFLPFSIVSSSVSGGYNDISSSFSSSFSIVDKHKDTYADFAQAPMQGPYTEKYVGGEFYRHQTIASGNISTRQEGYFVEYDNGAVIVRTPATEGNIGEGNLVPESTQFDDNIRAMVPYRREEFTKRPVSIKNIRHTTGSTIVGNYDKPFDYFNSSGRKENNLWFRDFTGSINSSQDIISFRQEFGQPLDRDFELPRKQRNENIITSRFSAPGERETMSRGYLNQVDQEFSPYNSINFRNRKFRDNIQKAIKREVDSSEISNNTVKQLPEYFTDSIAQLAREYNWRLLYARNTPDSESVIDLSGNGDDAAINGTTYAWDAASPFGGLDQLGLDFDASPSYVIKNGLTAMNSSNEKMLIVSHTRFGSYSSIHRFSEIRDTSGDRLLLYATTGDNLSVFDGSTAYSTAWLPRENQSVLLAASYGSSYQIWANGYLLKDGSAGNSFDFATSFDYSFGVDEAGGSRTGGKYGFAGLLDQTLTNSEKAELFKTIMNRDTIYYWDYLVENSLTTNLLVHLPFFETQNTTTIVADVSQNENHATAENTPTFGIDPLDSRFVNSVRLNDPERIIANTNINISTTPFTVHFWYKPEDVTGNKAIWSIGTSTSNFIDLRRLGDVLNVSWGGNAGAVTGDADFTSFALSTGTIYRIQLEWTGDGLVLRVSDGTNTASESTAVSVSFASSTTYTTYINDAFRNNPGDGEFCGYSFFNSDLGEFIG
jgi:hypothetical protein